MAPLRAKWKSVAACAAWTAGVSLVIYGALFSTYRVLDKPTSTEGLESGMGTRIVVLTEAQMVKAVSAEEVVRTEDGWLLKVPGAGGCTI